MQSIIPVENSVQISEASAGSKARQHFAQHEITPLSTNHESRSSAFVAAAWISLCLTLCLCLAGCAGGFPGLSYTGLTTSAAVLDSRQSISFATTGTGNLEITWSLTGTSCSGSTCGLLTPTGNGTGIYTAPVGVAAPMVVTITGTVAVTGAVQSATLTVNPTPTVTGSLPTGTVGSPYSAKLTTADGTGARTLSLYSGSLPSGLSLDSTTGTISGTPTTVGTTVFSVAVTDSAPTPYTSHASITIVVNAANNGALQLAAGVPPTGYVGKPYSTGLTASGGTPPYVYSITSGALPAGLTLAPSTGLISGTPTVAGAPLFAATVQDSVGANSSLVLSITVLSSLSLTTGTLPNGTVGTPYSATIGVTGGTAPYTCSLASGTLPAGLTLGAGCVVSGTPTSAGTVNLMVTATDSSNPVLTTTGPVSLTISPAGLAISSGTLPAGTVGTPYSSTVGVTGGTSPYSCSVAAGALPLGLVMGPNCLVTGTPLVAGTATMNIKATDSGNPTLTTSRTVLLTINAPLFVITPGPLPDGTVGISYNTMIPVTGGTLPYACTIVTGVLPAGLTLGPDCVVSGTPTSAVSVALGVKATDSSNPANTAVGVVTLTIHPASLAVTPGNLPDGTVGTFYSATIPVTGGTSPYTCAILSGTLPAGLILGPNCQVTGLPLVAGSVHLMVLATDSSVPANTAIGTVGLTIDTSGLTISTGKLPDGTVGVAYSSTIGVTGGAAPYSCAITSGVLPAGLTLGANCLVSGVPLTAGTATLGIAAIDSSVPAKTATGNVVITVDPAALVITMGTLPNGTVAIPYAATIPVAGGSAPYTCALTSGTLPLGLTLGPNCLVSGIPLAPGTVSIGVTATDSSNPAQSVSGTLSVTINPATLILTGGVLPIGVVGTPYANTIPVTGGTAPYSCSINSGSLPAGLSLGANCVISGTPLVAGVVTLGVTATDSDNPAQTASGVVVLTVTPATLILTGGVLPVGTVGTPYTSTIPVLGGTAPYSCSITSGTLPAGLTLGTNCVISGTPTVATVATLGITATDSSNPAQSASGVVVLTINPATLILTGGVLPIGTVGTPYSATIPVLGGTAPYSCSVTSGALPSGLTLGANCAISGTPTVATVVTLGVKVTDNGGQTATGTVVLTVLPATLIITGGVLPVGTVGTPYNATIPVLGGTAPYSCSITSGTLPAGLTLGANCLISGTPTTAEVVTLGVRATDSESTPQTANGSVVLTINPSALILTGGVLPVGVVGTPYTATIPVIGGTAPYSCFITSGTLQAGLTLGANCVISGTPTAAAVATLGVKVTDNGGQTANGVAVLTVTPATLILTGGVLPVGVVGTPYTATIPVLGGTAPYSCSITSGTLPDGLSLGVNCAISGTPSVSGTVTLGVKVTDSESPAQSANGTVVLTISPATLILTGGVLPVGTVGTPYTATIPVVGGTAPYSCSITSGTLPAGLSLGANCAISGTPTTATVVTLGVKVTDSESTPQSANGTVVLTISPATLILTGGVLPVGTVGTAYTATIPVLGGTSPYSCTITSGTLPAGLALGANCEISGTPTTAAVATLGVKVTDGGSPAQSATGTVVLTVTPATLILTGGLLPAGVVGTAYSATVPVLGGTAPYSCTLTSGTLPAGLTIGAGCVISGTPTTAVVANLGIKVTDTEATPQSATGTFVLTITPASLILTGGVMPVGVVGTPYSATIPVVGGTAPYSCSITSGTLPAGLTLGASCVISGIPTAPAVATLGIKATDSFSTPQTSTGTIVLTVTPATLVLTGGVLPVGVVGTAYSATIPTLGGTAPYSCSITSGTLPAGLTLGANCQITGTPAAPAVATLGIKVTDSESTPQTATGTVVLTVTPATLIISAGVLPVGAVGTAYTATIPVLGGTAPYSCSLTSGALPAGLTLGVNCEVSGTPTAAAVATLTLKVTDGGTPAQSATGVVVLTIAPATLILSGGVLPVGTVGTAYNATVPVLGGTSPYICTITSGTLPAGLTLGAGCAISGTPTAAAVATLGLHVTDGGSPAQSADGVAVLTITPAALIISVSVLPNGTVGQPYSQPISITGGVAPYSCSITAGTLPAGLTLGAGCVVSGTPTTAALLDALTIKVTDSQTTPQTATGLVTLTVAAAPLTVTSGALPNGQAGVAYSATIPVMGGTPPYTCIISSLNLPLGLTLGSNCAITGTPLTSSSVTLAVLATDSALATATGTETLAISAPATLTLTGTLPNATVNVAYSQTLTAAGGVGPYTYAVTSGTLPTGLTLNLTTGVVSGTPTVVGGSSFTVTATDTELPAQTATLNSTMMVNYAPTPYDGQLSGPYAFLFQGYDTVVVGALTYQTATVGSFTADGNGSLTSGELDSNHQTSTPTGATVPTNTLIGSYTVASDNTGTVVVTTLNTDGTVAANNTYAISLKPAVAPATTSVSGTMAEADTGLLTGQRGIGNFQQQTATTGLAGNYAFGLQGDVSCTPACSVNLQAGPVATVGQISAAGSTLTGLADTNVTSTNYPNANLAGTLGSIDAMGRLQMSAVNPNIASAAYPLDYAVYMIDAYHAYVMSTDKHSSYMLLAGNMTSQTGSFSNASMSGQFVGYENALTNPGLLGGTLQNVANLSIATIFQGTANGAGGCTTNYVDQGGTTALVNSLTGVLGSANLLTDLLGTYASTGTSTCTVAATGRAVLNYPAPSNVLTGLLGLLGVTAQTPAPRVVYLTNTNTGYFLETGYAGLGTIKLQFGQPFTLGTLNGTYTYGTTPAATAVTLNASGTFTANGAGTASYNLDEDVSVGGLNVISPNVTGSGTYVLADGPNGRYTFGTDVIYAISPTRFVLVDKSATNTSPSVSLLY